MMKILALVISVAILVLYHLVASVPFSVTPSSLVWKLVAIVVLWLVIYGVLAVVSKK
jgi:hypothetical protein